MKQKIVIKVQLDCDECRSKALKRAAEAHGVSSVSLEGEERDQLVVTGDQVDAVCLARVLRKKFRCVRLLSVEEVKKPADPEPVKTPECICKPIENPYCCPPCPYPPPCGPYQSYYIVNDPCQSNCSIM